MVSIALATYNGERFLKEQLDSILNQTYTDIEITVLLILRLKFLKNTIIKIPVLNILLMRKT